MRLKHSLQQVTPFLVFCCIIFKMYLIIKHTGKHFYYYYKVDYMKTFKENLLI